MSEQKKTASSIVIERFLKEVDKRGYMPWQRPYSCYNAFNYFTMTPYRGINRIILEFGEYLTANQINQYNKEHGEDFRFQKGIEWLPVIFFKEDKKSASVDEVVEALPNADLNEEGYLGHKDYWSYWREADGSFVKKRQILRYSDVAERKYFKNSKGEMLPSRIETGEVEITLSNAQQVFDNYVDRSGIVLDTTHLGVPCYEPYSDTVRLNKHTKGEDTWFSTAFHEFAHSTGAEHRLNRVGVAGLGKKDKSTYAVEECIAEIAACLCCAECGIYDFETSGTMEHDNHVAYVQSWKKKIQEFDKEFIYICSQADKAFNYIMNKEL